MNDPRQGRTESGWLRRSVSWIGSQSATGRRLLLLATIAMVAVIVMGEIDKVLGSVMVEGRTHTMASIFGPFSGWSAYLEALDDWAQFSGRVPIRSWIVQHATVDMVFVIAYTGILCGLRTRVGNPWHRAIASETHAYSRRWLVSARMIVVLAVADIIENVLAVVLASGLPDKDGGRMWTGTRWVADLLSGVTLLKVFAVLVVVGSVLYGLYAHPQRSVQLRRWGIAAKMQRFSLVIVGLMAVFMIVPGAQIFDQASDIERTWLLDQLLAWDAGLLHLLFAALMFGALTWGLLWLGRRRTLRAVDAYPEPGPTMQEELPDKVDGRSTGWSWAWPTAALVLLVVAVILEVTKIGRVNPWAAAIVIAIPIGVWVVNLIVEKLDVPEGRQPRKAYPGTARAVSVVGELVGYAVLCVFGLSMVRAFTAPAILDVRRGWAAVGITVGCAVALAVWAVSASRIKDRFHTPDSRTPEERTRDHVDASNASPGGPERPSNARQFRTELFRFLGLSAIPLGVALPLLIFPRHIAQFVGVLGIFAWGLSVLALILAILALTAQKYRPLLVFRMLGLDATPTITLVVLGGLVASAIPAMFGVENMSHRIGGPDSADVQTVALKQWRGNTFHDSVETWLTTAVASDCGIIVPGQDGGPDVRIKPMIFIAATGGGIRATWWTVQVASRLADDGCAEQSVLATSGASGGAVGLALMYKSADPVQAAAKMSASAPLAQATGGLIVRDTVAGLAGVDMISIGSPDSNKFPDRAGLIEQAWEDAVPELREPFPGTGRVPWRTFLNSTSARTGCRVVIGDVRAAPEPAGSEDQQGADCHGPVGDSAIPGSYELFAAQPCLAGMHTSTAALLASRFPYIAPSGVTGSGCSSSDDQGGESSSDDVDRSDQLIDGGYAENSGIGTLLELSAQAAPLVRAFNAEQIRAFNAVQNEEQVHEKTGQITVVVPVVISIDNTPQQSVDGSTSGSPVIEPLVPVTSGLRRGAVLNDPATLLDRFTMETSDWLAGCTAENTVCADPQLAGIRRAVDRGIDDRAFVVAPPAAPGVAAPLGWVMSSASREAMSLALNDLLPPDHVPPPVPNRLYDLMNDLQQWPQ